MYLGLRSRFYFLPCGGIHAAFLYRNFISHNECNTAPIEDL
ncbi:hypothetical protein APHDU1_1450 [Anaplasma phagocytophilum]|uniref:Uncharacterized protein n=1 Tax=Anaplasma phagocytophilum str. NCH-1 TaxID=1359161 RepID=A0A0F3NB30_ANAPH|nr:hypothetical protein EPHNCH_0947 [Anaplasma phagocytophilum str. NCH-1]KJV87405.1 hypothetical protein APHNYW_0644 [Anaplasma phagocytophilum str. ApNYW]KJZ98220.1 hypothetical protein APHDU1_1450 [Anaplasma phagocytophilum]